MGSPHVARCQTTHSTDEPGPGQHTHTHTLIESAAWSSEFLLAYVLPKACSACVHVGTWAGQSAPPECQLGSPDHSKLLLKHFTAVLVCGHRSFSLSGFRLQAGQC